MERDGACLDFPLLLVQQRGGSVFHSKFRIVGGSDLDVDLVSTKDDRNVLAHPLKISVPVGDIFVGDA